MDGLEVSDLAMAVEEDEVEEAEVSSSTKREGVVGEEVCRDVLQMSNARKGLI